VASTSVADIRAGLDDRFRVLAGGRRRAVERHQTMRAAIDWSHNLLDRDEQVVLRRLAVFAGGFTMSAACIVCRAGFADDEVRRAIESLVRKSMVHFDREQNRYRLLETVRAYAQERLAEGDEDAGIRQAHAEWMAGIVDHPLEDWYSERGVGFAEVALREVDNWREAVTFAVDTEDCALAPRLCQTLLGGDHPELGRWAQSLLAAIDGPHPGRQWVHWAAATAHGSMLQLEACEAHLDQFDVLATHDVERAWSAVFRSMIAETRDRDGRQILQRALEVEGIGPAQRTFLLILNALYSNIPPNNDLAAAMVAVAEAERIRHYTTPLAYVTLAMASATHDTEGALAALTHAQASAEEHPSAFIKTSVAGWGSMTLVGLPADAAAAHLLTQAGRMQRHWTNAHIGLLASCANVLRQSHPDVASRLAGFLLAKSGAGGAVRDLVPDVDLDALEPSTDDIETIMTVTRDALARVATAAPA
jgi:hypothetical protein